MIFRHLINARGFFSDYYLGSVFGRGTGRGRRRNVSDRETDLAYRRFVQIHRRADGKADEASVCRERFVRPLIRDVLGLHLGAGTDRIHAVHASAADEASGARPLLLVWCGGWSEDPASGRGQQQPSRQLEAALVQAELRFGLFVSGERLRLLRALGEGPQGSYLEVDLDGLASDEDPESFAVFYRLLSRTGLVPDAAGVAPIEVVERESREQARRVSADLKDAVFRSAETLVSGLLDDACARGDLQPAALREEARVRAYRDAALTALYRMLFILYAESRDPRLRENDLYVKSYSMQGALDLVLRDTLRAWPENRCSLWERLRALFRIYDDGLPAIAPWENLPPRGGDFFDATTPDGRILDTARLPDAIVAQLLLDLATTQPQRGVGRERISFRELDIESLGAVYEGLLEYEPRLAAATSIELIVQARLLALSPEDLVLLCEAKGLRLRGDEAIVRGTPAGRFHVDAVEEEGDADADDADEARESGDADEEDDSSEGSDEGGITRGATAKLLRRIEPGRFHFVHGSARKGSGSFYTPIELVQDLARHALGPLVVGKTPEAIERLRMLDPACGSGHFLVEAMRFLGRALHRAYVEVENGSAPAHFRATKGLGWDAYWEATDAEARASNSEARAWCKRRIAERCLFGVDLNPTAVGLARVALWIESLAGDRPLTYFEHHVRCGNSLLGTWLGKVHWPPVPALGEPPPQLQTDLLVDQVRAMVLEAAQMRLRIDGTRPEIFAAQGIDSESLEELEYKERLHRETQAKTVSARLLFDLRTAAILLPDIWGEWQRVVAAFSHGTLVAWAPGRAWWQAFEAVRERERFFHWELEFPEVLLASDAPGFDAILGNPPWDKVLPAQKEFYARHDALVGVLAGEAAEARIEALQGARPAIEAEFEAYRNRTRALAQFLRNGGDFPFSEARTGAAHEDVSKYFVDRAARLLRTGGAAGIVVPSVLYNGDGCVGLRKFLLNESRIVRFYGFENRKKIFPIHASYKFVSLVFQKGARAPNFTAAFMRQDLAELVCETAVPWQVRVSRAEVERLSPVTSAFLEYRGPRDQEIVRRMHAEHPTLASEGRVGWGAELVSWRDHTCVFNSTEDRDLFTNSRTSRLHSPAAVLGREPRDFDETLDRMRERGFWPVFEGKHVDQFLVGRKPVRWWLSVEQAERKYGRPPRAEATLVFRETASNTNERTCIAAVLPEKSAASHTLTGVVLQSVDPHQAAAVFNSLAFDFALRLRTAGTHVSFTYILPMPVPSPAEVARLPRIRTRLTWADEVSHITEDKNLWPGLWQANRAVAEAYGLGPSDFTHILTSFPGFARKRAEFVAYLQERLADWADHPSD